MARVVLGFIFFIFLLFCQPLLAAENGGCTIAKRPGKYLRGATDVVKAGPFVIYYSAKSVAEHARPHFIDDLIVQLRAADAFYQQVLNLKPPLKHQRYERAKVINVYVAPFRKGNGVAYDEVRSFVYGGKHLPCALSMAINEKIDVRHNVTPAHELFHLYQNAYAMFKVSWYNEGTARLVESAFAGPAPVERYLKDKPGQVNCLDVVDESYSASRFWWHYFHDSDVPPLSIPDRFEALHYHDGTPVFKTNTFYAGRQIRPVLEALSQLSDKITVEDDLDRYRWPEKVQQSGRFDKAMCKTLNGLHD